MVSESCWREVPKCHFSSLILLMIYFMYDQPIFSSPRHVCKKHAVHSQVRPLQSLSYRTIQGSKLGMGEENGLGRPDYYS